MRQQAQSALSRLQSMKTPRGLLVPWNRVREDWALVELDPHDLPMNIRDNYTNMIRMRQWCRDHCHHPYSISETRGFAFSNHKEAFRFRLQHGDL